MEKYLVWNSSLDGYPPKAEHNDLESAKKECARLASLTPGKTFHVLKSIGRCKKADVEWIEDPLSDGLLFNKTQTKGI